MKKKENESDAQQPHPRIIEIEEQEIEEKKPPNDNIISYKMINRINNSKLEEE